MIQHARARRVAIPSDLLERLLQQPRRERMTIAEARQAEASLDILLKHALHDTEAENDSQHVWQKLARKMMGPFGTPALEGPTQTSLEVELTNSGGWSNPIPFVFSRSTDRGPLPDIQGRAALWNFLRFDCISLPRPGTNSLLA